MISYVPEYRTNRDESPVDRYNQYLGTKSVKAADEKKDKDCKSYFMCYQDKDSGVFMVSYIAGEPDQTQGGNKTVK